MSLQNLLNIAIACGATPLIIGLFAMLWPEVRAEVRKSRKYVAPFIAALGITFFVPVFIAYPGVANDLVSLAITTLILFAWAIALGYINPPRVRLRGMADWKRSIFDRLFGVANRNARLITFAGLAVLVIGGGIALDLAWLIFLGPFIVLTLFWVGEDIKF
jgi:hypothetical protein